MQLIVVFLCQSFIAFGYLQTISDSWQFLIGDRKLTKFRINKGPDQQVGKVPFSWHKVTLHMAHWTPISSLWNSLQQWGRCYPSRIFHHIWNTESHRYAVFKTMNRQTEQQESLILTSSRQKSDCYLIHDTFYLNRSSTIIFCKLLKSVDGM